MSTPLNSGSSFAIPQFALYGELAIKQDPEFVHIEDIAVRSSQNEWRIKPHRHTHLLQVLCMFSGELELQLDDSSSSHQGSWVISIPAGVVHGFTFHPDTKGVVLSLAADLLYQQSDNASEQLFETNFSQPQIIEFYQDSSLHQHLVQYLDLIRHELTHVQEGQSVVLYSLVKIVLMTMRRQLYRDQIQRSKQKEQIQLTGKFRRLLEEHYTQHWKISDYAQAMHISTSTLNRLCHSAFNNNAKTLIKERVIIEAKRRLIYTSQTLEQIADTLGFKDPAYFSRVFKLVEGHSPKVYRASFTPNNTP